MYELGDLTVRYPRQGAAGDGGAGAVVGLEIFPTALADRLAPPRDRLPEGWTLDASLLADGTGALSSAFGYRAVPGAKVELLPGLGHPPLLEDPPRTATPLPAFAALHAVRVD